jgi:uncharacterized membrane protein
LPGVRLVKAVRTWEGAALRAGFEGAEGDIIVMLDADGSMDPREIPLFIGALVTGAEFVKGTRFAQGAGTADMSRLRRFGNRLLGYAVRLFFGGRCRDLCYGYMAFWKRVLPRLNLDVEGFEIETQMSVRALSGRPLELSVALLANSRREIIGRCGPRQSSRADSVNSARYLRATEMIALTLLVGLLGLLFISRESLWLDEAFSVELAGSGWPTLWGQLSHSEANGSVYYVVLHAWLMFGKSEFAARSLSVVAAIATIPPFYAMAARLFTVRTARISSLLLAVNSFFIYYAQEARSYALALLLVVLASYAWTRLLDERSWTWAAAYAVTASLAVYAHLFSLYVVAAHAVSLVARDRKTLPSLKQLAGTYGLLLVLLVPDMIYFATGYTAHLWWVQEPSLRDLGRAFLKLSGGGSTPSAVGWLLLLAYMAAGCLALAATLKERRATRDFTRTWPYALLLAWLFVPTLGSFFLSFLKPMFVDRYLIVALPALALVAGIGLASIETRAIRALAVGGVLALAMAQLAAQYVDRTKGNWRQAVAYTAAHARGGDAIVFYPPYARIPFEYYLARKPRLKADLTPLYPASVWTRYNLSVDASRPPEIARLALARRFRKRVWLALSPALSRAQLQTQQRLLALFGKGRLVTRRTLQGSISLVLFDGRSRR